MYQTEKTGKLHITPEMHVTACLAGQTEDVEVGEGCRTLQALKDSIAKALPQLCVEGFDVSVGGRALDDEGVVSLEEGVYLDVSANTRGLSVLALREAGRDVSEAGLWTAAAAGDVASCTLYLDAGVPLDCVDGVCRTPLHLSCCRGHLSVATLLLDRGSTAIDKKCHDGETPLHLSCAHGHLDIVTLLLDRGSTAIDKVNEGGQTPLHLSCARGHLDIVTLLLDRGSTAIDKVNCYGTPLHLSCARGHLDIATLLLDRGSTAIDEVDGDGDTPLHDSCAHGHLDIVTLLLDRGSTAIDKVNCYGTPLHLSCARGHLDIATLLLDRGSTAIDEVDRDGDTPLHDSCRNGHLDIARLLLDRGCSVDVDRCRADSRCLELLSERGHANLW